MREEDGSRVGKSIQKEEKVGRETILGVGQSPFNRYPKDNKEQKK